MLNRIAKFVALLPFVAGLPVAASAQNIYEGQKIAERWCSSCHVVDFRQRRAPNDAIPSFPAIAQMKSTTRISLAAFLSTSHEPMPNFALSRREIADVSAYILSLRKSHERANE